MAVPRSRDPTISGKRSDISPKLLELETSNLVGGFVLGMPSRRTNNIPESGCGLGHVTPIICGIRSNISLKLLARDFKFDTRLCMGNAEQAHPFCRQLKTFLYRQSFC